MISKIVLSSRSRRGRLARVGLALLAAGAAGGAATLTYAVAIEPNWIEVKPVELLLPRLPASFDGYRVAQISDLHAGLWMPGSRLRRMVRLVNEQDPDLIAITGDFVTRVYRRAHAEIVPVLRELRSKDGVVAVLGNHDYWGKPGPTVIRRILKRSGIVDLSNRVLALRRGEDTFYVAGVDSVREGRDRLDKVLKNIPAEGAAAMLLAHEPDFADVSSAAERFDLQISGHSHGGQVAPPLVRPLRLPPLARKYPIGLYQVGNMMQYTNRGLGMVGLPVRFLARPEITVFTLRSPLIGFTSN